MADYQIRNRATGSVLFNLANVEFSFALCRAKEAAIQLDGDVAIYGEPLVDAGLGFIEELWCSE